MLENLRPLLRMFGLSLSLSRSNKPLTLYVKTANRRMHPRSTHHGRNKSQKSPYYMQPHIARELKGRNDENRSKIGSALYTHFEEETIVIRDAGKKETSICDKCFYLFTFIVFNLFVHIPCILLLYLGAPLIISVQNKTKDKSALFCVGTEKDEIRRWAP